MDEPSREQILAGIEAQICPWCGRGPFAMLPVHTNKMHDIDKWALRDLAGLTTRQALCSPEVSEKMREANLENPHMEKMWEAAQQGRSPKRWTEAGIEKNRSTIIEWTQTDPERHRAASSKAYAARTPEGKARSAAAATAWNKAHPDEIRKRFHSPAVKAKREAALARTRAAKYKPCGTRAAFRRGCRCEPCVEANSAYRRAHG